MRARLAVAGAILATACSGGQQPAPTTTAAHPSTTTTVTTAVPTTTAGAPTTTAPTTTAPTTTVSPIQGLAYQRLAGDLVNPTFLAPRSDGVDFLITKAGQVWQRAGQGFEPYLDISDRVTTASNEQGLLGMAWHPDDPDRFFLHYSDLDGDTVVSEFNGDQERIILRADQPAANHNGGMIAFGPDGFLYIALGDGGGSGDRFGTAQRTDDLLGGLLRIDVDGDPYRIPPSNPFAEGGGAGEVWAIGLRNPWRFWFDQGLLYIGDVGQNAFEEIDVVAADAGGLNFGWPHTEGLHCFDPRSGCDTEGQTLPVLEVEHGDEGACSVTGGVVYRGRAIPELTGHYLYSDYCGGWLRSFRYQGGEVTEAQDWTEQVGNPGPVLSFGTDASGEVYILTTYAVFRLVPLR
jgi:glucose/arabinose dehydrogenase